MIHHTSPPLEVFTPYFGQIFFPGFWPQAKGPYIYKGSDPLCNRMVVTNCDPVLYIAYRSELKNNAPEI